MHNLEQLFQIFRRSVIETVLETSPDRTWWLPVTFLHQEKIEHPVASLNSAKCTLLNGGMCSYY